MNFSPAILPLIISSPITIHVTHDLFTATLTRTADMSLKTRISQQYDTGNGAHLHTTRFLFYTRSPLSSHFRRNLTISIISSWSTPICRSLRSKSAVACTSLSDGTAFDDANPCNDISLSFSLFSFSSGSLAQHTARNHNRLCTLSSNRRYLQAGILKKQLCTGYKTNAIQFSVVAVFAENNWKKRQQTTPRSHEYSQSRIWCSKEIPSPSSLLHRNMFECSI